MIASKTSNGIDAINKFQRRLLSIWLYTFSIICVILYILDIKMYHNNNNEHVRNRIKQPNKYTHSSLN